MGEQVLLDTRGNGSDPAALAKLVARLARGDDGVVRPYAVSAGEPLDVATTQVDRHVEEIAALGLDADGVVRVDDSFIGATVSLTAQVDASAVVLDWSGPRWAANYVLGNEIDGIGGASNVPTFAVHVPRHWERVVVQLGSPNSPWEREDSELAATVALAMRGSLPLPIVLLADDAGLVDDCAPDLAEDESARVILDAAEQRAMTEQLAPGDLLVTPAHVIRNVPPIRALQLVRALHDSNVVVVAGPHRLTLSQGAAHRRLSPTIGPAVDA